MSKGSQGDEWGTPQWLFDILNKEFEFQQDVCATSENTKCKWHFTKEHNALLYPWAENYFCNPPYSNILPWALRALAPHPRSDGVHLVKHDPSTKHGQVYAKDADELRILEHRLTYEGAPNCANFPSAIAVFRKRLYTRKTDARILYVDYRELIPKNKKKEDLDG